MTPDDSVGWYQTCLRMVRSMRLMGATISTEPFPGWEPAIQVWVKVLGSRGSESRRRAVFAPINTNWEKIREEVWEAYRDAMRDVFDMDNPPHGQTAESLAEFMPEAGPRNLAHFDLT